MTTEGRSSVSGTPFPVRLTSFVGRVAELGHIGQALACHRLVSLVGPGGSGKTRLALEAARAWTGGARWFVDLAALTDDTGVEAALAVATDAPEGPGELARDATVRRIGQDPGLLVLDNCDQVVVGCAGAVDGLLRACPRLTVLATSREPLRVEGEKVWRVPPLSLPDEDESMDYDAVLLFLDRAGLSPAVAVRDGAAIHRICRRLDGMPLAIELAASRASALPVTDILAGLSDRFRLLTGGPRPADTRQQSLAESIGWSYRLLADAERTVLRRLAAFRSSFTSDAARAVAAGDDLAGREVLPLLASLVDKSFVVIDEREEVSRYRLLETIREYAIGQLAERCEDDCATRDRHLRYIRQVAERLGPMIEGGISARYWPEQFQAELADVSAALAWAAETDNTDDALRVVGGLDWFWYFRARGDDLHIIDSALAMPGGEAQWRAKALIAATRAAMARLDPRASAFATEAVRLARESGDLGITARALSCIGWSHVYLDLPRAQAYLQEACELAQAVDDQRCRAEGSYGLITTELDDLRAARARTEEALAIANAADHQLAACNARMLMAMVALMQGSLDEAMRVGMASLRTAELLGERLIVTFLRGRLGSPCCGARTSLPLSTRRRLR